jgi:signal transduction histidine kinase
MRGTVRGLTVTSTLLLGVSAAIDLGTADLRAELWVGLAAGVTFLLATALHRGSGERVLLVRARLLGGAGMSALIAVGALWQVTDGTTPRVLLLLIPVAVLFTTAALVLREAVVLRSRQRLGELRSRLDGEESERRRWVRELHDDTLQELAVVQVLLGSAEATADAESRALAIVDARRAVGQQIQTLRRLIARMRPLVLDSLGLVPALEELARQTGDATGITVEVRVDEVPRLPADAETDIYRIVYEATTNAVRHAGASRIEIEGRMSGDELDIAVRDDGRGRPPGGFVDGYGLRGMKERAVSLGAQLHVGRPAGGGTLIQLRVPLRSPAG